MDICKSIKETPVYKIKLWKDQTETTMYIFVGREGKPHKSLFDKLENDQELDRTENQTISDIYGTYYPKKLGIAEKNKKFIFETIYNDDTISTLMSKIVSYVLNNNIHEHQLYCWVDRTIKNDHLFQEFVATQIMKKKKLLDRKYVEFILNAYTNKEIHFTTEKVTKLQILQALKNISIKTVKEPLLNNYLISGVYQYFYQNAPFQNKPDFVDNDFIVESNESYNLEHFHIDKNIIHLITTNYYTDKKDYLYYFPKYSDNLKPSDYQNLIQKADTILQEINEKTHDGSTLIDISKCQINYLHLRIKLLHLEDYIPLKKIFNMTNTTTSTPFIKHSHIIQGNQYKILKDALTTKMSIHIPIEYLNKWIETDKDPKANFKSSKSYVMFKLSMKTLDNINRYFTVILFEDGICDIKYSFKLNEVVHLNEIIQSFKLVNNLFESIKNLITLPKLSIHSLHVNNQIMEIVNMRTNMSVSTKEPMTFDDIHHFVELLTPYFNVIDTKENELLVQYKRINNYITVDNITYFLNQKMNEYLEDKEKAIQFIQTQFDKTYQDAENEYEIWKTSNKKLVLKPVGKNMYFVPANTNIACIRIKKQSIDCKISVEGITEFVYHQRIINLIKVILNYSNPKKLKTLKFYGKPSSSKSNSHTENTASEHSSNTSSSSSKTNVNSIMDLNINDDDNGDRESKQRKRNIYAEDEYEVESEEHNEDEESTKKDDEKEENLDVNELKSIGVKKDNYVIKALEYADPQLFKGYSRSCQSTIKRQPIVITEEELQKLEKTKSFTNYIRYGTTPEKKKENIYICPEIWCPISRVSMTFKQFEEHGNKCPGGKDEPVINFYHDYWTKEKKDENGEIKKVIVDRYVSHLDKESQGCAPCCFKQIQEKKNNECYDEQVPQTAEEKDDKEDNYIVGLKYPLRNNKFGILPLLLNKTFKNKFCGTGEKGTGMINAKTECFVRRGIEHYTEKYNQSFYSVLGTLLYDGEQKSIRDMKTFIIQKLTIAEFLFVQNGQLCSMFIDDTRTIYQKEEFENFKQHFIYDESDGSDTPQLKYVKTLNLYDVIDALRECPFTELNKYNIKKVKHYKKVLREYLIYNSYTNFIKYLQDDTIQKTHDVLLDLCLMNPQINPEKYNIIVINIEKDNNVFLDCPFNYNFIDISRPFMFVVKQEEFYEPIYFIKAKSARDYSTEFKFNYHSIPIVKEIIDFFMKNCKENKTIIDDAISVYNYLNTMKYTIRYQVLNYNYKLIGFIVKIGDIIIQNGKKEGRYIYVPCKSTIPIFNKNVLFIYIDTIKDNIQHAEWENMKQLFKTLYEITGSDMYKLEKVIVNADLNVKGLRMKDDTFIPISKKYFEEYDYLENLNIYIGWEDDDPRKIYVDSVHVKELLFNLVKKEIFQILSHHEVYKYDYEFLKDDDIFPIEFRRKKLQSIIKQFMGRIVKEGQLDLKLPIPDKQCSKIFTKNECNNMCSWTGDHCKLTLPKALIETFTGQIADYILNVHQKYIEKDNEILAKPNNQEIFFKQSDVNKGRFHKIVSMIENPYLYRSKILDNYIKTLENDVVIKPRITTEMIFSNDWITPSSPHNAILNGKPNYDCNKNIDGFCKNVQSVFDKNYLFNLFSYIYKLTNAKFKWNLNIFKKVIENRLWIDFQKHNQDMRELVSTMKYMNRSFEHLSKDYTVSRMTIEDVISIMNHEEYIMSEYEIEVFANLIGIKFLILGRARRPIFEGIKCIRPDKKTKRYIILHQTMDMDNHRDRYEIFAKHQTKKQIIFNEEDYPSIKMEYLDKFCVAEYVEKPE
jgi:hypothetical protein